MYKDFESRFKSRKFTGEPPHAATQSPHYFFIFIFYIFIFIFIFILIFIYSILFYFSIGF